MSVPSDAVVKLTNDVFQFAAWRLASRVRDIGWMTETLSSFEEWCNWEAWLACTENFEWDVYARPLYSKYEVEGNEAGDFLVVDQQGNQLFVEVGLIHDGTSPQKWSVKCDADRAKLQRIADKVSCLHLIVVTTRLHNDLASASEWRDRWSRMACWNLPTTMTFSAALPERGRFFSKAGSWRETDEDG